MSNKKIDRAIVWLQEHDLISINRLEKKIGIPQRVLSKVITGLDGRALPDKYHEALIAELKKYGFK
jgi:hypothetical protein